MTSASPATRPIGPYERLSAEVHEWDPRTVEVAARVAELVHGLNENLYRDLAQDEHGDAHENRDGSGEQRIHAGMVSPPRQECHRSPNENSRLSRASHA